MFGDQSIKKTGVHCQRTKCQITWLLLQEAEIWPGKNRKLASSSFVIFFSLIVALQFAERSVLSKHFLIT